MKISATAPTGPGNRHYHIGCKPGDLAEYIILVGDPERAEKVAQHFDKVRFQGRNREYVAITGTYQGFDLSVLGTGIGQDNTEIAVIEICQITKNPTFLRCGTTGSLQKEPKLADLIVSRAALRLDNTASYFAQEGYPAVADSDVLLAIGRACLDLKVPFHVGITASAPGFYGAQGRELPGFPIRYPNLPDDLARINVMNFEMETGTLFVLSSIRGIRAGAVCATVANRPRDEFADKATRDLAEQRCIEVSLKAFEFLKKMDAEKKKTETPPLAPGVTSPAHYKGTITKALNALKKAFGNTSADVAVVLGSGLGSFADRLEKPKKLSYAKIPGFPGTKVHGHAGECVVGTLGKKRVLLYAGRFHYYEGHSPYITTLPIRVAGAWGIKTLFVTNAAGGIRKDLRPGSLMLIRDHLNLLGANPLRGPNLENFGPRFLDLTEAYDRGLRNLALRIAAERKIELSEGVYAALSGPTYETPSEVKMLATLGADAVGMSTVPEVIVARHHGMRVLGVSCIANSAAGVSEQPIAHEHVIAGTQRAERQFSDLLSGVIECL